ncbi:hypothetical protein H0H81_012254 [Sphagnurus paluster]|uniref:Uncharacterized protein n=1 Tax=Sphagnurus paluster TaxID=117069 RepID=A0A9P7KM89_9AGAR|nr:hypothetical protein H0H81_012254 [Sphagnurus paluster]
MPKVHKPPAKPVWPPIPPPDDTEEARVARIAAEEEAKRISDSIDRSIGLEREQRKRGNPAKILLLGNYTPCMVIAASRNLITLLFQGQAESGKSTILKNFQLHFSPKAFQAEVSACLGIRTVALIPVTGRNMAADHLPQSSAVH